ncbi:MAG: EamA family transporter [Candidatus Dojkabacteria bacterium]|jgi:drug/metabolite transporter (DMT)-like permease
MKQKNNSVIGILLLLLAALFYGMYGIFYRKVGSFGVFTQGYLRSIIIIFFTVIIFLINTQKWKKYENKDWK